MLIGRLSSRTLPALPWLFTNQRCDTIRTRKQHAWVHKALQKIMKWSWRDSKLNVEIILPKCLVNRGHGEQVPKPCHHSKIASRMIYTIQNWRNVALCSKRTASNYVLNDCVTLVLLLLGLLSVSHVLTSSEIALLPSYLCAWFAFDNGPKLQ